MSSEVFICNLALSSIGAATISSLTEASAGAIACNNFYAHTRDTLLQWHPWNFAKKVIALAELDITDDTSWLYRYERPSDCLKIRHLSDASFLKPVTVDAGGSLGHWKHEVRGNSIYCDLSPAYLNYTFRNEDPTLYPPLFQEALAFALAVRLAMPLTADPKLRAEALQLSRIARDAAAVADANEEINSAEISAEMFEARK